MRPEPPSSPEFRHRRRVQFYETDAAGIVHFSWYFRYMEEAEHALWRAAGLSVLSPDSGVGWPRVSAAFDYQRPLRFEEEFDVAIRVAEVRSKTIRYACVVERDGTSIGTGTLVTICVRHRPGEPMKAVPIPVEILSRLGVTPPAPPDRHEA